MKIRAVPGIRRRSIPKALRGRLGSRAARCCLWHLARENRLSPDVEAVLPEEDRAYIAEAISRSDVLYWQVGANFEEVVAAIEFVSNRQISSYFEITFDQTTASPKSTLLSKMRSPMLPFHYV